MMMYRLFILKFQCDPQKLVQEQVEVRQGMTGWMHSTPLLMDSPIHCQGTDQVVIAAVTAILLRTEMQHHQALVATAAPPRIGCHQHHHRQVHLTGIREPVREEGNLHGAWFRFLGLSCYYFSSLRKRLDDLYSTVFVFFVDRYYHTCFCN